MANEVLPDALPYFDKGYEEPGVREAALKLVEEETRRYRPTKNYLDYLPAAPEAVFLTPVLRAEFERIRKAQPMDILSFKRYELPPPLAGQKNDMSAWMDSVNNSSAQLQHQSLRIHNLELLETYGVTAWEQHVKSLLKMHEHQQRQLQQLRQQVQEVNWQRKTEQIEAGTEIATLEKEWGSLVAKNYEIDRACLELEVEIQQLRLSAAERGETVPAENGISTAGAE
ncbi:pre-mRNA-splicing factor SPF27-like [Sycon ciliatum]|uniref:pre-mRNA-splicing factor SPF27-like n=1 Tax=Sycon ciliatum TaxID=27933 RepID=UPI0020ADD9DE|eukprot:scpid92376/ scgid34385/ Pre-mRNA-splicing factor SPF27; Protein BCAS2 homolog